VGIWDAPETGGLSSAVALRLVAAFGDGVVSGAVGNTSQQVIDTATGAQTQSVSFDNIATEGLYAGAVNTLTRGFVTDAKIPGFSSGTGNMKATGQTLQTKFQNGAISRVNPIASIRAAIGTQASNTYQTLAGMVADLTRALASLRTMSTTQNSK
jgi:hypothetical protein